MHRGALLIEGTWSTGLTFRHADGSTYGAPANPRAAAVLAEVHEALTGMGFKEREARWMVKELCPHMGGDGIARVEDALRRALNIWRADARSEVAFVR